MASELGPRHAPPHNEAPAPANTSRATEPHPILVVKLHDMSDFRTSVLVQHGEETETLVVDSDVADYVVILASPAEDTFHDDLVPNVRGLTREEIADRMETTLPHVRQVEPTAQLHLARSIVEPVEVIEPGEYDSRFLLQRREPAAEQAETAAVIPLRHEAPFHSHVVQALIDEIRPFTTFPSDTETVITRQVDQVAAITDETQLLLTATEERVQIPVTAPLDPTTILDMESPFEYFDRRVVFHTAHGAATEKQARGLAMRDIQGKLVGHRVSHELRHGLALDQLQAAVEIAERAVKHVPQEPTAEAV